MKHGGQKHMKRQHFGAHILKKGKEENIGMLGGQAGDICAYGNSGGRSTGGAGRMGFGVAARAAQGEWGFGVAARAAQGAAQCVWGSASQRGGAVAYGG